MKQRKDEDKIMEIKHLQYIAGVKLEEEERNKRKRKWKMEKE